MGVVAAFAVAHQQDRRRDARAGEDGGVVADRGEGFARDGLAGRVGGQTGAQIGIERCRGGADGVA